jgi:hypothetical protein
MEAMARSRWSDKRLDDLKGSVERTGAAVERLQHAMIIAMIAICTTMLTGFAALVALYATRF